MGQRRYVLGQRYVLGRMAPDPSTLTPARADDFIAPDGRPTAAYRERLRRIPNFRNALSVVSLYVQTIGVLTVVVVVDNLAVRIVAFLL
ncbi:MAG: hypothetical protein ACKOIZ_10305, partial [Actinomycetota bacterium]